MKCEVRSMLNRAYIGKTGMKISQVKVKISLLQAMEAHSVVKG
jgi:hypothetical protein